MGAVAFAPNNTTLAVGDENGSAYLWNTATGKNTAVFATHDLSTAVDGVAFTPDGATLIIGNVNGSVYLWQVPK